MIDSRDLSFETLKHVDQVCDEFEHKLTAGQQPVIESIIVEEGDAAIREYLLAQLVATEIDHEGTGFNQDTFVRYRERFVDFESAIEAIFRKREMTLLVEDSQKTIVTLQPQDESLRLQLGSMFGKYEVVSFIGEGSFGVVYSARDTDLERDVALKLSRFKLSESSQMQNRFIEEAKSAAKIKGDGVATIFDLFTEDDRICIVQEYVDGCSLSQLMRQSPLLVEQAITVATSIAGSIARAHDQGIYHRDLKPGNIIIDRMGNPILVDFGLAVSSRNLENRVGLCGTPNYMSPEQVRCESNRTNSTTDIWALGVVLYEMLTGSRPFRGKNNDELFEAIQSEEPTPLYEIYPSLSKELNRITLKCLAKRQCDRYSSADLLVKDLTRYTRTETSEVKPLAQFVPKGLRSFSAADHGFYASLLPGPRDHRGMPESIAFWTRQIEEEQNSFPVGLIYGTSGCGKSSFVNAGLIPQLSSHIRTLYIEANQFDTELRIFSKLRSMFSGIPGNMSLPDTLATIRDGDQLRDGEKILIVIDQFEQWLSSNSSYQESQLGYALRHCDGESIQALLLIREDYWPSASRFMEHIEVPVVQDRNCRPVELFDRSHAKELLFQIGRAHQRFRTVEPTEEQSEFLDRVVNELAENDRVVGIRLAMFSEAFKDKEWTVRSLGEFGGADGAGVAFLNETFVLPGAPPAYKSHQRAAKNCIQALLPDQGSNLKGLMKPRSELLAVSGYANEPGRFNELLDILEQRLKLIASTEPVENPDKSQTGVSEPNFQLSHDYLVPVTRRWIDIEDRRHLQGRVEARMSEVAEIWGEARHSRYLPTWWESVNILMFSRWKQWSGLQREMMFSSVKKHSISTMFAVLLLSLAAFAGFRFWQQQTINKNVHALKTTLLADIESKVESLQGLKQGLVPKLQQEKGRLGSITPVSDEHKQVLAGENLKLSIALAILNDSNWSDVAKGFDFVSTDQVNWLAEFLREKHGEFDDEFIQTLETDFDPNDENQFRKSIVMAQWGSPEYLAKFLTFRKPGEGKDLLPVLRTKPEIVCSALGEIVSDLKTSVFAESSRELDEMVELYDGKINDECGVVFSVPFELVRDTLKRLFAESYVPTSVRPYYFENEKLVAITFRRGFKFDRSEFDDCVALELLGTASDVESRDLELIEDGWRIADVSYLSEPTGQQETGYSSLWIRENSLATVLELEISEEYLESSIEYHSKHGFQVERLLCVPSRTGAPNYSLIWSRSESGTNESVEFLAAPEIGYAAKTFNEVQGASLADSHISAIDLSGRDRLNLYMEMPRYDLYALPYLEGALIRGGARNVINRYALRLARVGDLDEAIRYFQRIVEDNPGWVDQDLGYIKVLSGLPDDSAFQAELSRLKNLNLNAAQEKILLPISSLRMAVSLGDFSNVKSEYFDLLAHFDRLEKEYSEKADSLDFIHLSRIRANLLYAKALDESDPERQALLDSSAAGLFNTRKDRLALRFLLYDPDYDILRDHREFQKFLCFQLLGYRIANSWRIDAGVTTRSSFSLSISDLKLEAERSMDAGFVPKTVSCQGFFDTSTVIGRLVSERRMLDESVLRQKRTRLARSAILLNALGQPELMQQIEEDKFGEEVRVFLQDITD